MKYPRLGEAYRKTQVQTKKQKVKVTSILLKYRPTGQFARYESISDVLEIINRDRPYDWIPYNQRDWKAGLLHIDYDLMEVIE